MRRSECCSEKKGKKKAGTLKWKVSPVVYQIRMEACQVNDSLSDPGCEFTGKPPYYCVYGYIPYLEHQWNCKLVPPDHDSCSL